MNLPVVLRSIHRARQIILDLRTLMQVYTVDHSVIDDALLASRSALLEVHTLRPVADYHEDFGDVLWYHLPLQESPIVGGGPGAGEHFGDGRPTDCQLLHDQGWLTHWTPLPTPIEPEVKS